VNVGVWGLVVAQHLYRRAIALQILLAVHTARVLIIRLLRARGMDAVRKMAALTPPLVPSASQTSRRRVVLRSLPSCSSLSRYFTALRGTQSFQARPRGLIPDVDPDPEFAASGNSGNMPM
jgi:hypothetical protein